MQSIRYRMLDDGESRHRVRVVMRGKFEGFVVRQTDSCTGCFETVDGYPAGNYPYDEKAQCYIGAGCHECGYRGKVRRAEWVPFPEVHEAWSRWCDARWKRRERLLAFWRARAAKGRK